MSDILENLLSWFVSGLFSFNTIGYFVILIIFAWILRGFQNYFDKRFSRIEMMLMYMNNDPTYEKEIRELFLDENYKI